MDSSDAEQVVKDIISGSLSIDEILNSATSSFRDVSQPQDDEFVINGTTSFSSIRPDSPILDQDLLPSIELNNGFDLPSFSSSSYDIGDIRGRSLSRVDDYESSFGVMTKRKGSRPGNPSRARRAESEVQDEFSASKRMGKGNGNHAASFDSYGHRGSARAAQHHVSNNLSPRSSTPTPTHITTNPYAGLELHASTAPLREISHSVLEMGTSEALRNLNSHDDVIQIAPQQVSPEAQKHADSFVIEYDSDHIDFFVKADPKKNTPVASSIPARHNKSIFDILAAEKNRLNNNRDEILAAQKAALQGSNEPVIVSKSHSLSNGESSSSNSNPKKRAFGQTQLDDDRAQADVAMRDGEEDHAWMNEEPEDTDLEYKNMCRLRDLLARKQSSGTISGAERMELFKVGTRIKHKERLRYAANMEAEDEEEEELFLPEKREDTVQRHRRNRPRSDSAADSYNLPSSDNEGGAAGDEQAFLRMMQNELGADNDGTGGEQQLTKAGKPRKRQAPRAKNAREYHDMETERKKTERNKAQKKKGRGSAAVSVPKKKVQAKKDNTAKRGKKGKEKGKGKKKTGAVTNGESLLATGHHKSSDGRDDVGQMILEDLMNNDPISDRLQNPIFNASPEPTISGRQVKQTQFATLFANIPGGSSRSNARHDKQKLQEASKSFGYAKVKAVDGKWLIKGMKSTLYHHQLLGAQWMVSRELSSQPPHGGLLADSMGLGKTVQTLACMVGNPPGPEDIKRGVKATLIVVPAGVLNQWYDEIKFHASEKIFRKVLIYKSSSRIPYEILSDLDIVLTSYSEVMKQFPFPDKKGREKISDVGYKLWWKHALAELGILHQIHWYRVVLDEAQAIKNNSGRTSLACQNLKSVYRWCLTGTPLLNRLEELFPYIRFLKANYSMDWQTFQKYFCDPNADDCYNRISTLLSYTMMRRTMKTTILNRPIITLPPPHPEILYVSFSQEEQIIYRITENRFRCNLNTYFASNNVRRNYGFFMVQLLRLRQCTSHPFMLERTIKESWTMEDVAELRSRISRLGNIIRKPFYDQCKVWVEESDEKRKRDEPIVIDGEIVDHDLEMDETLPFGQGDYGHKFDIDKALQTLNEQEMYDRVVCGVCSDLPQTAMQTDCGHIFCKDCLHNYLHERGAQGDEYTTCPTCDRIFSDATEIKSRRQFAENDDDDDMSSPSGSSLSSSANKKQKTEEHRNSKGKDALGCEPFTKNSTWIAKSDVDDDFPLTPSAKTAALKSILLKGFHEAPLDKVVIYVQFRALARIVGRICNGESWGFLYLTGESSLDHRSNVIKQFRDNPDIKILIAGLKCGGLGLNFPWANRCISLDLWWNHAVEQQAFGRIFRIGQEKDTYMTRIVVKNTVDMRLLSMQLHKLQNLEKAIRDGDEREKPNLSLKQLANLFGFLKTDEDNNIISVEPDYIDGPDDAPERVSTSADWMSLG